MYSAVVFGWPVTTIRPRRFTSTPTEIMLVVEYLRGREMRDIHADQGSLDAAAIGADADIAASRSGLAGLALAGKEVILNIEPLRREDIHLPQEEGVHLLSRSPDGRGGG